MPTRKFVYDSNSFVFQFSAFVTRLLFIVLLQVPFISKVVQVQRQYKNYCGLRRSIFDS